MAATGCTRGKGMMGAWKSSDRPGGPMVRGGEPRDKDVGNPVYTPHTPAGKTSLGNPWYITITCGFICIGACISQTKWNALKKKCEAFAQHESCLYLTQTGAILEMDSRGHRVRILLLPNFPIGCYWKDGMPGLLCQDLQVDLKRNPGIHILKITPILLQVAWTPS